MPVRVEVYLIIVYVPLNIGVILNIVMQPVLENCPKHVSIKNNGIPQKHNIKRYGMRNAPKSKHFKLSNDYMN